MGWPTLLQIPCLPAALREKLPISQVRLECRINFASTNLAPVLLAGVPHTNFVRQMRASAPSGPPVPEFCGLQCLTTSQRPHETTTAEVLPTEAWARRHHLTWCSRIPSRHTCCEPRLLQIALVDADPLALEGSLARHTPAFSNWHHIPDVPILHEIKLLLASSSGQLRWQLLLGDCVPIPS